MKSKLSILGLLQEDPTILSGLIVPEGLDAAILTDYIMMECADLEILYPEPTLLKQLITSWATARQHSWERLYLSTVQQYNMIHNYDRTEIWDDTGDRARTATSSGSQANSNTQTTRRTVSPADTLTINKAGYNSASGLVPAETQVHSGSTSDNGTVTDSGEIHTSGTAGENEHTAGRRSGHAYGNIGVTTAAQMLTAERELYKWDVYAAISQEFKERFCILLY